MLIKTTANKIRTMKGDIEEAQTSLRFDTLDQAPQTKTQENTPSNEQSFWSKFSSAQELPKTIVINKLPETQKKSEVIATSETTAIQNIEKTAGPIIVEREEASRETIQIPISTDRKLKIEAEKEPTVGEEARQKEEEKRKTIAQAEILENAEKERLGKIAKEAYAAKELEETTSPEIFSTRERAKSVAIEKATKIMDAQNSQMEKLSKEVTKIATEKERLRNEVLGIFDNEKKALSDIIEIIKKDEAEHAKTLITASAQKRAEIERRAEEAERIAMMKRTEAILARKNADRQEAEAEASELIAKNEREKAENASKIEADEIANANKQAEIAIAVAINEINLFQKKIDAKAEEIILIQEKARKTDILEEEQITNIEKGVSLI